MEPPRTGGNESCLGDEAGHHLRRPDQLGPAFTWATPVYVEGTVRDGTLTGGCGFKARAIRIWCWKTCGCCCAGATKPGH